MDIVYPYRLFDNGKELRYSLRSLKNIPHDKVWIVGEKPDWIRNVNYIPLPQRRNKWANARSNIIAACENPDVSDDFYLFNDDFYVMQEMDEIPYYHRGSIDDAIKQYRTRGLNSNYVAGLIETAAILKYAEIPEPHYAYNLHLPMKINKHQLLECIDYIRKVKPRTVPQCFHLRSWYGNFWQVGGTKMRDVKMSRTTSKFPSDRRFLSTSNSNFNARGPAYKTVTKAFPEASVYEIGRPDGVNKYQQPRISPWSRLDF